MFNELAANYCARCGAPLAVGARFCSACGTLVGAPAAGVPTIELAGARYDLASFWRRAGAFLIDGFFWSLVSWPLSAAFQVSTFGQGPFPQLENGELPSAEFWDAFAQAFDSFMVYLAVSTLTVSLAQVAFEAFGWSPGKAVLGIRTRREDGHRPGVVHGLARSFARLLSSLPFFLGYLWASWDPQRQTWHDKLAHTYVVRLPVAASAAAGTERTRSWGALSTAGGPWIWAGLEVMTLVGVVSGALVLAAAVPDDGASWQRFFDQFETPTPAPAPFRTRVSEPPVALPTVRLVEVRTPAVMP